MLTELCHVYFYIKLGGGEIVSSLYFPWVLVLEIRLLVLRPLEFAQGLVQVCCLSRAGAGWSGAVSSQHEVSRTLWIKHMFVSSSGCRAVLIADSGEGPGWALPVSIRCQGLDHLIDLAECLSSLMGPRLCGDWAEGPGNGA